MTCSEAYANSWQYASFWCDAQLLLGVHDGAGPADIQLIDNSVNFINAGARPNEGQIAYNLTQNVSGEITGVTENSLTVSGVTWNAGDQYRSAFMNASEQTTIDHYLSITAGDIHAALASVGACDCTFSDWGANYLAEINIILSRVFYDCPCAKNLDDAQRDLYSSLAESRLQDIRSGAVDVCQGATGSDYPSIDFAQHGWNEFSSAGIIEKDILKDRSGS